MATKQKFKEYRVLELPTSGLKAGDRYYLNVGGNVYKVFLVSDSLQLFEDSGDKFLSVNNLTDINNLDSTQLWALEEGLYQGIKLNNTEWKIDSSDTISANSNFTRVIGNLRLKKVSKDNSLVLDSTEDFNKIDSFNTFKVKLSNQFLSGNYIYQASLAPHQYVDNYNVFQGRVGYWVKEQLPDAFSTFSSSDKYKYKTSYRNVILSKENDIYNIYRKCGMDTWERIQMKRIDPTFPFRIGAIDIVKPTAYFVPKINSEVTLTGTWTEQRSGGADLFIGGLESASSVAGNTIEVTFTPSSPNAIVGIVSRFANNTGKFKVTINGGTDLINLLPKDSNGDVIIDTYSPTQIDKNHIPIASSLPQIPLTIKIEDLHLKNDASSNFRVNINAIYAVADGLSDPLSPLTHAPTWTSGKTVVATEHIYYRGNEYSAVNSGTTGATPPTHSTGTVSDGAVDWLWIRSSYASDEQMIRQDTSECEYAGIMKNPTTNVEGEWGGDLHKNEVLNNIGYFLDGSKVELSNGQYVKGFEIKILQDITVNDPTTGNTPMFHVDMEHYFTQDGGEVKYVHTALKDVTVVGLFQWMFTVYHYDQLKRRFLFSKVETPKNGAYNISDSYGNSNAQFGREKSLEMRAIGTAFKKTGAIGNVTETGGTHDIYFTTWTDSDCMRLFKDSPAGSYVQVNPSGKIKPDGGALEPNSGIFTKFYFSSIRDKSVIIENGKTFTSGGGWNISCIKRVQL